MSLTDSEKKLMEKLAKKAEQPDAPSVGKSVNVLVDLKDAASVALAKKFGFLPSDDDDKDDDDNDDEPVDDAPKRRGYFGD